MATLSERAGRQSRVQATYRGNYKRLQKVKTQYDPNNLFRVNQNIVPSPN